MFAFQQRKGSRCGDMIEMQVIVTWFTPEEKLLLMRKWLLLL